MKILMKYNELTFLNHLKCLMPALFNFVVMGTSTTHNLICLTWHYQIVIIYGLKTSDEVTGNCW